MNHSKVRASARLLAAALMVSGASLGGCASETATVSTPADAPPLGSTQSVQLDCGFTHTYTNTSGKREYVQVNAANNCEFTAYLYFLMGDGRFIPVEVRSGEAFNQPTWLPAGGAIEFVCTLVDTVNPSDGCAFDVTVLRRE